MRTKVVFLFMAVIGLMFSSCEKEEYFMMVSEEDNENPSNQISLNYSLKESQKSSKAEGTNLVNGQTITGNIAYYFSFWLNPSEGVVAKGIYTITNTKTSAIVYGPSAAAENGIDFKFPEAANYSLKVEGNYDGQNFLYENITIIVTPSDTTTGNTSLTSPVRLYDFSLNGTNAIVKIAISKAEYQSSSSANWFYVKRTNGQGFVGNQSLTSENDSVRFTLTFPANSNDYIEFNVGYHDGSSGGMWLTPSIGQNPSILWSGNQNLPYTNSGSFFGFRLHVISSTQAELRNYGGTTLITFNSASTTQIPGEAGDGPSTQYTVRWSGFKHFFKTSITSPTFRYKVGTNGTWNFLTVSNNANPSYKEITFPDQTTGEIHFQWGTGTGTSFVPATSEMAYSIYWSPSNQSLVKNI